LEALVITAAILILLGVRLRGSAARHARRQRQRVSAALHTVAHRLGSSQVSTHGRTVVAEGLVGRARVHVEADTDMESASFQPPVRARVHTPGSLSCFRVDLLSQAERDALASETVPVDDPRFDRFVRFAAEESEVLAWLSAGTRSELLTVLRAGIRLEAGVFRWEQAELLTDAKAFESRLRACLDLAQRLPDPDDIPAALLANALNDPLLEVRNRNLGVLLSGKVGEAEAIHAARHTQLDHDPALLLQAGILLGREGAGRLRHLVTAREVPEPLRRMALERLVRQAGDAPSTVAFLHALLELPGYPLAAAALEALDRLGPPVPLELLRRHRAHPAEGTREVVAELLGLSTESEAQEVLWQMLARRDEHDSVLLSVFAALGRAGDRRSVRHILPFTAGLLRRGAVKEAARNAILEIQGRLGEPGSGRLSLAGAEGPRGELTLADGDDAANEAAAAKTDR
jgi:hypothetical protein